MAVQAFIPYESAGYVNILSRLTSGFSFCKPNLSLSLFGLCPDLNCLRIKQVTLASMHFHYSLFGHMLTAWSKKILSYAGMQVGTQWCFMGQLNNYDGMPS
jgi:hypothetical protein